MDLRKEAEERALRAEQAAVSEENRRASFRSRYSEVQQNRRQSIKLEMKVNEEDYSSHENETPKIAQLAEIDYKWNGSRAKNGGNFVLPRWVPDEEIMYCHACNSEFDFINRKHHCRHCGMVYCDNCSQNKVLLPHEYGYRDPVRVCNDCNDKLVPLQQYLSTNIANHQRVNNIDIASTNCNVRRYMNMPFSSTLGSEIRKAAYSTHNLFSQPLHFVRDKAIPLRLLANAQGLAFITMIKGGFIFAPRLGKIATTYCPIYLGCISVSCTEVIVVDRTLHGELVCDHSTPCASVCRHRVGSVPAPRERGGRLVGPDRHRHDGAQLGRADRPGRDRLRDRAQYTRGGGGLFRAGTDHHRRGHRGGSGARGQVRVIPLECIFCCAVLFT